MTGRNILLGNEAMAHGLLESSCTVATSYPGTPASEILAALLQLKDKHDLGLHAEWSINEKVAFEVALANSFAGRRSAVIMKQVGLNVAADPLMSSAYTGVKGGFVVIAADDPGPHSSQTEQDSRFFAMLAKIPVLDPSSPVEARKLVRDAFAISEAYEIPVMLRPTTRICHARQDMEVASFPEVSQLPHFEKDPSRWAATPKFRLLLHGKLNQKIQRMSSDPNFYPKCINADILTSKNKRICLVASGVAFANTREILADLDLLHEIPLYQVSMPYPLSTSFRDELLSSYERILVLEESYPVIELQLQDRVKVRGRSTGTVPSEGELLPELVEEILRSFLGLPAGTTPENPKSPGRRPTLCAGCPHRAAFFAIKKTFPKGIYPSDIGCYTLGLNLGVVDTVLCMGAAVSQAAGFYHAYRAKKEEAPPIAATIGDSTFFHAGIPALINAVIQGARFVLVILDNSTTAMTGHQPTAALGKSSDGTAVPKISIEDLVRASGVRFVEEADPYQMPAFSDLLKRAGEYTRSEDGGIAVAIARHPCIMDRKAAQDRSYLEVSVNEKCKGCDFCVKQFECPALVPTGDKQPVRIDRSLCSGCGVCIHVCPHGALELSESTQSRL